MEPCAELNFNVVTQDLVQFPFELVYRGPAQTDQVIISIPTENICGIDLDPFLLKHSSTLKKEDLLTISDEVKLAIAIILYTKKDLGPCSTYLKSTLRFPLDVDIRERCNFLEGTLLHDQILDTQDSDLEEWKTLEQWVSRNIGSIAISAFDFLNAKSVIRNRSIMTDIAGKMTRVIIPLKRFSLNPPLFNYSFDSTLGKLYVHSILPFNELHFSQFGPCMDNHHLMYHYGEVVADNPLDSVSIDLAFPEVKKSNNNILII